MRVCTTSVASLYMQLLKDKKLNLENIILDNLRI